MILQSSQAEALFKIAIKCVVCAAVLSTCIEFGIMRCMPTLLCPRDEGLEKIQRRPQLLSCCRMAAVMLQLECHERMHEHQQHALLTKSVYEMSLAVWSRYVPGTNPRSQALRSSIFFLLKAISRFTPSSPPTKQTNSLLFRNLQKCQ